MASKLKNKNKHQKAMLRAGEHRIRRDEIDYYLELSRSDDPAERFEAAENLCPCHVRTDIHEVRTAVLRMMEDPDVRVRRSAWHTLEDGGIPNDPAVAGIFQRAVENLPNETDRGTISFIEMFAVPYIREQEEIAFQKERLSSTVYPQRGKCDFCGSTNVPVRTDFDTEINLQSGVPRLGLICANCDE